MNQKEKVCTNCGCPDPQKRYDHYWCKYCHNEMTLKTKEQQNHKSKTYQCHCGAKFDGIECYECGFDATEIDIY